MKPNKGILDAYIEHKSALQQFLIRRLGCSHTAADILQKMAEKLLLKKTSTAVDFPKAYLYQAARNELVDFQRSEQVRRRCEAESAFVLGEFDDRDGERAAVAESSLRVLNAALQELPPLSQHIFMLYRVGGVKQTEIARQLGLNLSTVEKRLATAMKHCRQRLRECEIDAISSSRASSEPATVKGKI